MPIDSDIKVVSGRFAKFDAPPDETMSPENVGEK